MSTPKHPNGAFSSDKPRIAFVANVDWFFLSHRLAIANAVREAGASVFIIAQDSGKSDEIRKLGFCFVPLPLSRSGRNPFREARSLWHLLKAYRRVRPDLVHHITIKPIIYGSLAARLFGVKAVVNAVSGLGYAFSSNWKAKLLQPLIIVLYKAALRYKKSTTIFQNREDRADFVGMGLLPMDRTMIIRGSGVNTALFELTREPKGDPLVLLAGRMLKEKGIDTFVEAARIVRRTGIYPNVRFVLVGAPDPGNPGSIPGFQIQEWVEEGVVQWWGYRDDMPAVLGQATVVTLPTRYREGLPKILLEAAACGRPLVASDVPGCREIVRPDVNGFLVQPNDGPGLAKTIQTLLGSSDLRARFGMAGRQIVEQEFSEDIVIGKTLALYRKLCGGVWPAPRLNV